MNPKKQVWLPKMSCWACEKKSPHEGHIFHRVRHANNDTTGQDYASSLFYSYFFCDGLTSPVVA